MTEAPSPSLDKPDSAARAAVAETKEHNRLASAVRWFKDHAGHVAVEAGINFVLPLLIYDRVAPYAGDIVALLASTAPPLLWSLVEFVRRRRVDALSLLVLAGIALSLLALLGGGSARLLQLRENLVTALIGIVFLGSAAIGRPLIYQLARASLVRQSPEEVADFEAKRDMKGFRRVMTLMTLVWGFGLLASAALACVLVFSLSIRAYLIVSPFVGYGSMGALVLWTIWYRRRVQRRVAKLANAPSAGEPMPVTTAPSSTEPPKS